MAEIQNVSFYQIAASNQEGTALFSSNGAASTDDGSGDIEVRLAPIDSLGIEHCTFLKLDTEGAELSVLESAKKLIQAHQPIVAITVYHRASDYIDLFCFLKLCLPNHKIYFRHYTESSTETVMYFVPGEGS